MGSGYNYIHYDNYNNVTVYKMCTNSDNKLDKIIELQTEILAYNKLQVDLLQQLLESKNTNMDKTMDNIISVFANNPIFGKMGITKEILEKALKNNR
jgi:hypothetical protein